MKKFLFFENAKVLAEEFGIIPLLYGSLGLEYITGKSLDADDIDILIPEVFVKEHWSEFEKILTNKGYMLFDEHEHTFQKDGVLYSYASIEELESFAGIKMSDIKEQTKGDIKFKVLNLQQYLKVYRTSLQDGYRINIRKKKDDEKIEFIENLLKSK